MTQKFYLRNALASNPPTAGEKSTVLPVDTLGANNATGDQESRALDAVKGTLQTSHVKASDAVTAARDNYLGRWTSKGLQAGTYGSGTWTIAIALSEQNANANSLLNLSVYFWRPSTSSVVGFVYDSHTNIGIEWATTEDGQVITFTGVNQTIVANDVLVVEVWRHAAQGMTVAYTQTVYFDGTTDVTDTTTTDAASYLNAPADIPEAGLAIVKVVNETVQIAEAENHTLALVRVVNETVEIPEATNKIIGLIKNVNETTEIAENTVKVLGLVKVVNETAEITENIVKVLGLVKTINETINISELENHALVLVRVINETQQVAEVLNRTLGLSRTVNESLETAENIVKLLTAEAPPAPSTGYGGDSKPTRQRLKLQMPLITEYIQRQQTKVKIRNIAIASLLLKDIHESLGKVIHKVKIRETAKASVLTKLEPQSAISRLILVVAGNANGALLQYSINNTSQGSLLCHVESSARSTLRVKQPATAVSVILSGREKAKKLLKLLKILDELDDV